MKMPTLNFRVKLIGKRNQKDGKQVIDYYLVSSDERDIVYAFTGRYTNTVWNVIKGGVSVNKLLATRTLDSVTNKVIQNTKRMVPYLVEEYGIA